MFSDKGKLAAVCPLDNCEANRTVENTFCPVSVLDTFSKIYERVMKQQLVVFVDTTLDFHRCVQKSIRYAKCFDKTP